MRKYIKKVLFTVVLIFIIVLIITGIVLIIMVYFISENECDPKHKIINKDPNKETLYLNYDNYSQSYNGKIGPMYDNYGESVKGAEVILIVNNNQYIAMTDKDGNSTLRVPQDIIDSIDLDQKYTIKVAKKHYHDLSWKVKIEIIDN